MKLRLLHLAHCTLHCALCTVHCALQLGIFSEEGSGLEDPFSQTQMVENAWERDVNEKERALK